MDDMMGFLAFIGFVTVVIIVTFLCCWLWEQFTNNASARFAQYKERRAIVKFLQHAGQVTLARAITAGDHFKVQDEPPQK